MKVPVAEAPEGLKELVNQFFDDYEVYVSEEVQMEGDPTSFEEAMRNAHSSKWLETMKDEMKLMKTNGDLEENVYMAQPKGFVVEGKECIGCRLKKSIYGLKQASRQSLIVQ